MTREQAKQTALNFMRQQDDYQFSKVVVKSMEPAGGRIRVWLTTTDHQTYDPLTIEVEIDPMEDAISWKKICHVGKLSEHLKPATPLQKLLLGQRFRLQYDTVVYERGERVDDSTGVYYVIRRADSTRYTSRVRAQDVFPIE